MIKVFFCHSNADDDYRLAMICGARDVGFEGIFPKGDIQDIPRGYNAYFLHLRDDGVLKGLPDLRRDQPNSWIYGMTPAPADSLPKEISILLDNSGPPLFPDALSNFVDKINKKNGDSQ